MDRMSSPQNDNQIKIETMHGADSGHSCGYCKNQTGSWTYGFDSPTMSSEFYKSLMDSGWRRCGTYFYKPDLFKSCCKSYTIRMNAKEFKVKKSQQKVMKKWENFIYSNKSIESVLQADKSESTQPLSMSVIVPEVKKVDYSGQSDSQIELLDCVKAIAAELESKWKDNLKYFKDYKDQISFFKPEILKSVKILPSKCEKKGQFFTNYFMMFNAINSAVMKSLKFKDLFQELLPIVEELFARHITNFMSVVDTHSGQVSFFKKEKKVESVEPTLPNDEERKRINQQNDLPPVDDFNITPQNKDNLLEPRLIEPKQQNVEETERIEKKQPNDEVQADDTHKKEEKRQNKETSQGEENLKTEFEEQIPEVPESQSEHQNKCSTPLKNENVVQEENPSKMEVEKEASSTINQENNPSNKKKPAELVQTNSEVVQESSKIEEEHNDRLKEKDSQQQSKNNEKKRKNPKNKGDEQQVEKKLKETKDETGMKENEQEKQVKTETKDTKNDVSTHQLIRRGRLTIKIQLTKADQTNFEMYKRYCAEFHEKEKENFNAFQGFLCEKTLQIKTRKSEIDQSKVLYLGCFHMNYFIDDEFFAVGVVDLFEEGLSSVYFFYEPKWKKFSPGVIGAMYEIEYLRLQNQYFPKYKYYYLGFYIQNCQKMVYKGDYSPAELLCPRTYKWVELDERVRKLIDSNQKDPTLSLPGVEVDQRMSQTELTQKNLEKYVEIETKTRFDGQVMSFNQFTQFFQSRLKQIFYSFAKTIDKITYQTILFSYDRK